MTELPTTFGKYYLTEKLATGGMAEIYLAKIIGPGGFEKSVVIKQIHPKLSGNNHFVDLFVAEAKMLVTLTHGNIVPVYELGVVEDTYFIAMDYIDGPTLYRLTETMSRREGRMEPAVAAWITARMLDGLDYAHRKGEGVIHRDLSPRNVMLSRDGEVKLVDFGIAVTLGGPGEGDASQSAPTGSFPYMSPEQVRREPLTVQTDLFSVGVLFWEMLAGQRLFARAEAEATLDAVLREAIPLPSTTRGEVPTKLDDVVMRALERDRGSRWSTAGEMLAALNKYIYSLDETPGPREVAALVARFCPPETRRLPTHLEAIAHDVISPEPLAETGSGPTTMPGPSDDKPVASGPRTAVIPRDNSTGPKGKPQRQRTFATNVDLRDILDRATPLMAFDAIDDTPTKEDRPASPRLQTPLDKPNRRSQLTEGTDEMRPFAEDEVPRPTTNKPQRRSRPMDTVDDSAEEPVEKPLRRSRPRAAVEDPTDIDIAPVRRSQRLRAVEEAIEEAADEKADRKAGEKVGEKALDRARRGEAPSRSVLLIAGLGALALAGASIYMFYRGRDQLFRNERDAGVMTSSDAGAVVDTQPMIPPVVDAAISIDAGRESRDAGARRGDATVTRADAAIAIDAGTRGTAILKIGADPWGEIFIDGKPAGRTPRELTVPAGRHTIEIVFPAETPPRKQTFAVDLAAGETKPIQADFN